MDLNTSDIVLMSLQTVVFILAFSGNAIVVIVIWKYLQKRSITNRFIVNLAIADMLTALAALSQVLYTVIPSMNYHLNTCLLRYQAVILLTLTSQLTVTFTTFDRYVAICKPHKYRNIMSVNNANTLIALSWLYPEIVAILPFLGLHKDFDKYGCIYQLILEPWQHLIMALTLWIFSVVTAIMYWLILKKAFGIYRQICPTRNTTVINVTSTEDNVVNIRDTRMMSMVRGAKALAAVTLMFALCWLPYTYFQTRATFDKDYAFSNEWEVANWIVFLGMANSVMNPFIYAWQRKDFNAACRRLLSCRKPAPFADRVQSNTCRGVF